MSSGNSNDKVKSDKKTKKESEPVEVRRVESQSSVEISRSAKGAVQISVKIYDNDPEAGAKRAKKIYDDLDSYFPFKE